MSIRMMPTESPRVHVLQPLVPHYRVPLFDALAARFDRGFTVSASRTHAGGPASTDARRAYLELDHQCLTLLGGRLLWQRNLTLSPGLGPGDVAVVPGNPRYVSTFRFAYQARRRGVGLVIWSQMWSPDSTPLLADIRTRLLAAADAVLTYTDYEADLLRGRLGAAVPIFGAQNALDDQALARVREAWSPARLAEFRHANDLSDRHVLLFCGRLRSVPASDVDVLLQAVAILVRDDPRYLAVIIGDGDERRRLEALSADLDIASSVRWLGAQYDESAIAPWFMSALCSVHPGAIGLSMLHALSYGLPVVTHADRSRHGPEFAALRVGHNGLVFARNDAAELARQIARLCSDRDLRHRMRENAQRTVEQEFSLGNMVERFTRAVTAARERVLSRGGQRASARAR